jgi:hypothetical protein
MRFASCDLVTDCHPKIRISRMHAENCAKKTAPSAVLIMRRAK